MSKAGVRRQGIYYLSLDISRLPLQEAEAANCVKQQFYIWARRDSFGNYIVESLTRRSGRQQKALGVSPRIPESECVEPAELGDSRSRNHSDVQSRETKWNILS